MVKVAERGRFSVYVYAEEGQPHHLPHCHVLWREGAAVVRLPLGQPLAGDELPRVARELVDDEIADLIAAWNLLNPRSPIR